MNSIMIFPTKIHSKTDANSRFKHSIKMHLILLILSMLIVKLTSFDVLAHGEDKLGPHGGHIRMPGAFHTEVVPEKSGFRVYLLDINFKNPSVLDSSVVAHIQTKNSKTDLVCTKEVDSYICLSKLSQSAEGQHSSLDKPMQKTEQKESQKGELQITAKREGASGAAAAVYKLPLKLKSDKNQDRKSDKKQDQEKLENKSNNEHQGHH